MKRKNSSPEKTGASLSGALSQNRSLFAGPPSTTTHPLQSHISPQRPTPKLKRAQAQSDEVLDARLADHDGRQRGGSVPPAELVQKARERVQPGASTCAELSCNDRNHASTCAELLQELLSNFLVTMPKELFWNFFGTFLELLGSKSSKKVPKKFQNS